MDLADLLAYGTDLLAELEDLCGRRWESHVLLQLAAAAPAPLRRADLAVAIRRHSGGRPDDAQLNRTLKALAEKSFIRSVLLDGHKQHQLTEQGHQRAMLLKALLDVLARDRITHPPADLPRSYAEARIGAAQGGVVTSHSTKPGKPKATAAGVYDAVLGGADHTDADREAAEALRQLEPQLQGMAWANRGFLQRAAGWMAHQGIRRYLDIGAGLPTMRNTHTVVHDIDPKAQIVYVDNDPVTVARANYLLTGVANVTYLQHDLVADDLLTHPVVADILDGDEPVGCLAVGVLYFVPDHHDPVGKMRQLISALPVGSFCAISHVISDSRDRGVIQAGTEVYQNRSTANLVVRTTAQVAEFLGGLEIIPPYPGGKPTLSPIGLWGADNPADAHDHASDWFVAAVARKGP